MAKRQRRASVSSPRADSVGVVDVIDRYRVSVTVIDTTSGRSKQTPQALIAVGAWLIGMAGSQVEPVSAELLATGKRLIAIGLTLSG